MIAFYSTHKKSLKEQQSSKRKIETGPNKPGICKPACLYRAEKNSTVFMMTMVLRNHIGYNFIGHSTNHR